MGIRLPLCLVLALACCAWPTADASAQEDPIGQQLVGEWHIVRICLHEMPPPEPANCFPVLTSPTRVRHQLHFEPNGTATEITADVASGVSGPSGIYLIDVRETSGGDPEMMLSIAGHDMGRLRFAGDTLMLSRTQEKDQQFVRMEAAER